MKKIQTGKYLLFGILTMTILSFMCFPCGAGELLKSPTMIIGHTAPETGNVSETMREAKRGMYVALAEINETGGINGHRVDAMWIDDRLEKVAAVSNFRKLATVKNVFCIAVSSTGTGLACKPLAERFKTIQINGSSLGSWPGGLGEWCYRTTMPDSSTIPFLLKSMRDKFGVKKVGVMYDYADDWSVLCLPIIKKACKDFGLTMVTEPLSYARGDSDFSAQLRKLKKANPDFIVMPAQVREGSLIIRQARSLGITCRFGGTSGWISVAGLSAAGDAADGVIGVDAFHRTSKRPGAVRFYKRFKKMYPNEAVGGYLAPTWYDAYMLACIAARNAKVIPPVTEEDRIAIRDAHGKIKGYEGASGTFNYEGPGDPLPRDGFLIVFNAKTKDFDLLE